MEGEIHMTPNDLIRQYLKDHGIKQSFLADKCGWTRQRACKIINGKQKMTVDDFDAVCDALNVDETELQGVTTE